MSTSEAKTKPWYVWLAAFIMLQLSSEFSIFFLYTPGTADVYLTFAVGIALLYWMGPKLLILIYLNTIINSYFWGHTHLLTWFIFGIPETTFFLLSWLLFIRTGKGKFWLPDLNAVIKFIILGIIAPLTIYMLFLKVFLVSFHELDKSEYWSSLLASWLGDFMPTVIVSLPLLYFGSKPALIWLGKKHEFVDKNWFPASRLFYIEMFVALTCIVLLSVLLDFNKFWYLYGLISLIVSVRHGFGATITINLFILLVIYFIPAVVYGQTSNLYFDQSVLIEIYLGINLLSLFSIISGRVISDYLLAQENIKSQINKVEQVNKELDSFVYSVSHDLVAPLKSIKGLTDLLRKDKNKDNSAEYILRIEESADKLDDFIGDILDYSRSTRMKLSLEKVNLQELISEQIDNHRFIRGYDQLQFDLSGLSLEDINTDKMRLRIILNNLISNAIKFTEDKKEARIKFYSERINGHIAITVEDNGHGIAKEYQGKVFEMFFRASVNFSGSGLGLFIAKEAAKSMNGSIEVESEEGVGSRFIVNIPG